MIDATTALTSVDFRVGLRGPRVLWWAGCCAPHFEQKLPGFPYPHLLQTGGCFSCISAPDPGCRGSFQGGQRCSWHGLPANSRCDRNTGSRCALRVVRPARQRHGRYRSASWRPVTSNSAYRPSLSSLPESSIPALSTRSGLSFSAAFSSARSIRFSWAWLGVRGFGPLRGLERRSRRCFGPGFLISQSSPSGCSGVGNSAVSVRDSCSQSSRNSAARIFTGRVPVPWGLPCSAPLCC